MVTAIEIVPSYKVDHSKWDQCVNTSSNALVYATSVYLNHMADNWNGIIVGDYECVMPVPWRKKYGITYCYHVPFIQQLGWFSSDPVDAALMIQELFRFCKYGDYNFNYDNYTQTEYLSPCTNYVLDLSEGYEKINKRFTGDLIRNITKAYGEELTYSSGDHNSAVDLYKNLYRARMPHVSNDDFENFTRLCNHLFKTDSLIVRAVLNTKNELLAAILMLKDAHRLYNIMNCTTSEGRKTGANYFLFDNVIKEFACGNFLFDFEGSDIPGIKSFYEKFGGIDQPYFNLHFNHLSRVVRWMKR